MHSGEPQKTTKQRNNICFPQANLRFSNCNHAKTGYNHAHTDATCVTSTLISQNWTDDFLCLAATDTQIHTEIEVKNVWQSLGQ